VANRAAEKVSFVSVPALAEDLSVMFVSFEEETKTDEAKGEETKPESTETKTETKSEETTPGTEEKRKKPSRKKRPKSPSLLRKRRRAERANSGTEGASRKSPRRSRSLLSAAGERGESQSLGAMHAMIAYGVDTELIAQNKKVNAIGYLCYNGNCNGPTLFWVQNNKLQTRIGPGVQGHAGQFLAMLAQSRVRTDYPMKADGYDFKLRT